MICNELYRGQGLGNQLWNYAVTRVIAKKNDCPFSILGAEKFKGAGFIDLDFGRRLTGGASPEGGPPTRLPDGITRYYREKREFLKGTDIEISRTDQRLMGILPGTKFDGNCQSVKYLEGFRKDVLEWIKIRRDCLAQAGRVAGGSCVIHIRGGDFGYVDELFLSRKYFSDAVDYIKRTAPGVKFYCVTDQKDLAVRLLPEVELAGSALSGNNEPNKADHHIGGSVAEDFCLLMAARYLIIPNSSFSWWAAYLNYNKKIVVAPKYWARHNISNGYWSTADIITDGFTYLDKKGVAFTADECRREKNMFELSHPDMYSDIAAAKGVGSKLISRLKKKILRVICQMSALLSFLQRKGRA